ncbi:cytidylate kinase-like family protein [Anaerosporobacter faecicola]|uniref:cytidylate kinase-like family protein n=1 Tax=Anaerosporobacter faecicola TaxID=2718714 RepID=UPI00143C4D0D|nr:cytidylate kinase-like family protein [Anaerosporobacter faecicola]
MKNYVITIARGFGSGGKEIATKLAEELQIPCYERQILTMASQMSGIDESEFVTVDEKLRGSYLTNLLKAVPFSTVVEPTEKDFVSDTNLFNIQAEIIRNLAKTESCIIVGKCADHVLRKYGNVISVYIEAPRYACVTSIMNKMNVTEERANQLIKKTDKYRSNYYKYYTGGKDWTNPINYDLVLNSERIGRDKCVQLIKEYIPIKLS